VHAFQQDKVSAVIASYISEVVLALEPWAAQLKGRCPGRFPEQAGTLMHLNGQLGPIVV
jgi:hypothetical protein